MVFSRIGVTSLSTSPTVQATEGSGGITVTLVPEVVPSGYASTSPTGDAYVDGLLLQGSGFKEADDVVSETRLVSDLVVLQFKDMDGTDMTVTDLSSLIEVVLPLTVQRTSIERLVYQPARAYWDWAGEEWATDGIDTVEVTESTDANTLAWSGQMTCHTSHLRGPLGAVLVLDSFDTTLMQETETEGTSELYYLTLAGAGGLVLLVGVVCLLCAMRRQEAKVANANIYEV